MDGVEGSTREGAASPMAGRFSLARAARGGEPMQRSMNGISMAFCFLGALVGANVAHGASNPKAIGVRVHCGAGPDASCQRLQGWFQGRLEWLSGGVVLFQEEGPFLGLPTN